MATLHHASVMYALCLQIKYAVVTRSKYGGLLQNLFLGTPKSPAYLPPIYYFYLGAKIISAPQVLKYPIQKSSQEQNCC